MPPSDQENNGADASWRSLWLSSGALSIALLGDSLIYLVLPVNAAQFGVSLVWVGVLLAVNRIVRIFLYGFIASLGERFGLRNLCIFACITAIGSTASYGLLQGWPGLLAGRSVWGLSYAALLLVALGYAATDRARAGARVGTSRAIEQVGPLIAMLLGTWLAGIIGAQAIFLVLALASVPALLMALALPVRRTARAPAPAGRKVMLPKPGRLDILIFWMGAGVDGVFLMTLTLMLTRHTSIELAMVAGGVIVAGRRLAEMVAAPTSGMLADKLGVRRPLVAASAMLIGGFALVGLGWLITGSVLVVIARGALGTLFPAAVAQLAAADVLRPLARNQAWRDVGAAAGPLSTGFLLTLASPESLHLGLAAIYAAALGWLMTSAQWRATQ